MSFKTYKKKWLSDSKLDLRQDINLKDMVGIPARILEVLSKELERDQVPRGYTDKSKPSPAPDSMIFLTQ